MACFWDGFFSLIKNKGIAGKKPFRFFGRGSAARSSVDLVVAVNIFRCLSSLRIWEGAERLSDRRLECGRNGASRAFAVKH